MLHDGLTTPFNPHCVVALGQTLVLKAWEKLQTPAAV